MSELISYSGKWYLFKTEFVDNDGVTIEYLTLLRRKYVNKNSFEEFKINFTKSEIKDIITLFC